MKYSGYAIVAAAIIMATATGCRNFGLTFTREEKRIIDTSGSTMRVLTVDNPEDKAILRNTCSEFSDRDLRSARFERLSELMVATMTDPSNDGVGIAAPQVGISRRVIAVQRFDKENEPVEIYPNLRIAEYLGKPEPGREGCLSIPGIYGKVMRHTGIVITYRDGAAGKTVRDTVKGFTAVIFQHEADHLDGILYTDKADSLYAM